MLKLFLGIFTSFIGFIRNIVNSFSDPEIGCQASAVDRHGRPYARDDRPVGRPTCTGLCTSKQEMGRSTARSTGPESFALCIWAVDRDAPTVIFGIVGGRPGSRPQACQANRSA